MFRVLTHCEESPSVLSVSSVVIIVTGSAQQPGRYRPAESNVKPPAWA